MRGRTAKGPRPVPGKRLFHVIMRIWQRQSDDNLGLIAAGIAFYGLLSLFPGITAAVALAGLVIDPAMLVENSQQIASVLPEAAKDIILGQLEEVASADQTALGYAALLSLAIALWSASRATGNFIVGLNVVYRLEETRGIIALKLRTLLLTLALLVGIIFALTVVAALPAAAAFLGNMPLLTEILLLARWPVLFVLAAGGLGVMFRFGPNRHGAQWRWLTPGSMLACLLWVAGSVGFSVYAQSFGSYNETFGALGGVIVLLTWLWLSALIVLLGALVDAELQRAGRRAQEATPAIPPSEAPEMDPSQSDT